MLLGTGDAGRPSRSSRPRSPARPAGRSRSSASRRAASVAGPKAEAVKAAKEFLAAWHLADKDRPELAEMRALSRKPRKARNDATKPSRKTRKGPTEMNSRFVIFVVDQTSSMSISRT